MAKKKTKRPPKAWVYVGPQKVTSEEKDKIEAAFVDIIKKLKEKHVVKGKPKHDFNYIIDIQPKWHRHYFYLCAIYKCPHPNAISDTFETKFARLEFMGNNYQFNLSFMRHTGEWVETGRCIPLQKCIDSIIDGGFFNP